MNGDGDGAPLGAPDIGAQYRAGTTAVILAERPDLARLLFHGPDAADLLHRLSTNAVKGLREGEGVATVFTTNKGRILDLVTLHRLQAGLLGFCARDRAAPLREWVGRYTFREQVFADDWTTSHATLGLYGPGAPRVASRLFGKAAGALPMHGIAEASSPGGTVLIARTFPLGGAGFLLTVRCNAVPGLRHAVDQGAGEPVTEAGRECLEILRIEAGLPAPGAELSEEHNPWEARLQDAISLSKGCYVGQEIIARLHTYQKVSRLLVRITAAPAGAAHAPSAPARSAQGAVAPGDIIRTEVGAVGAVTSSADLPDGTGRVVALGYVRDEDAVAGRLVGIEHAGSTTPATIEGVAR